MANRSYLLAVDDPSVTWSDDPEREVIAEGIHEIPVFWAGLFIGEDVRVDSYEGEDDDQALSIPNWCVETTVAKRRLAERREPIAELLDDRSREVWVSFVDHVAAYESAYLKTNAAEVWALAPDAYAGYLATLVRLFTDPTPENLKAAVEANGLPFEDGEVGWEDDEETICKLAGAEHIRDVPWLDA